VEPKPFPGRRRLAGAFLVPYVKYPANPRTVGDPGTIGDRTAAYFTIVALSLLVVLAAWHAARRLREHGDQPPVRQLTVGLGVVVAVGALFFVLPAAPDPGEFPAGLLWNFRLSALGTQLVFWTGLGVTFGRELGLGQEALAVGGDARRRSSSSTAQGLSTSSTCHCVSPVK
jgi:hypothetical protein